MTRTARSVVFLCGLAFVLGGFAANHSPVLWLASTVVGALLIARSRVRRPLPLAAAIVLLGLAIEVSVVALPTPVDWPMVGVAGVAVVAAVVLLHSRRRPAGTL